MPKASRWPPPTEWWRSHENLREQAIAVWQPREVRGPAVVPVLPAAAANQRVRRAGHDRPEAQSRSAPGAGGCGGNRQEGRTRTWPGGEGLPRLRRWQGTGHHCISEPPRAADAGDFAAATLRHLARREFRRRLEVHPAGGVEVHVEPDDEVLLLRNS